MSCLLLVDGLPVIIPPESFLLRASLGISKLHMQVIAMTAYY